MTKQEKHQGIFPPEVAVTYNQIMTYFDYDLNVKIFHEIVKTLFHKKGRIKALELGIGTGHFAARLEKLGYEVSGIDDSPKMLEELKRNYPTLNYEQQNLSELETNVYDFKFKDIIFSAAGPIRFNYFENKRVFESYIPGWKETIKAIKNIKSYLNKDGLFIMSQNSDPEHPGFFKSTGDDMEVPEGMHYSKRETRDLDFIYKTRRLTKGEKELWRVTHQFSWSTPEIAEKILQESGFEVIGFDLTNTYHVSRAK